MAQTTTTAETAWAIKMLESPPLGNKDGARGLWRGSEKKGQMINVFVQTEKDVR